MRDELVAPYKEKRLQIHRQRWKDMGPSIIVYNNNLNEANIGLLSPLEQNAFFYICGKVRNMEGRDIVLSFKEYREKTRFPARKSDKDMIASFDKVSAALKFFEFRNKLQSYGFEKGAIFTYFKADPSTKEITVRVNDAYLYLFNNLEETGFYTRFNYEKFADVNGKHSKTLFRLLSQYRVAGRTPDYPIEYIKFLTGTEKYRDRDIREKVIDPAVEECKKYFGKLETIYSEDKRTVGFKFTRSLENHLATNV